MLQHFNEKISSSGSINISTGMWQAWLLGLPGGVPLTLPLPLPLFTASRPGLAAFAGDADVAAV